MRSGAGPGDTFHGTGPGLGVKKVTSITYPRDKLEKQKMCVEHLLLNRCDATHNKSLHET